MQTTSALPITPEDLFEETARRFILGIRTGNLEEAVGRIPVNLDKQAIEARVAELNLLSDEELRGQLNKPAIFFRVEGVH